MMDGVNDEQRTGADPDEHRDRAGDEHSDEYGDETVAEGSGRSTPPQPSSDLDETAPIMPVGEHAAPEAPAAHAAPEAPVPPAVPGAPAAPAERTPWAPPSGDEAPLAPPGPVHEAPTGAPPAAATAPERASAPAAAAQPESTGAAYPPPPPAATTPLALDPLAVQPPGRRHRADDGTPRRRRGLGVAVCLLALLLGLGGGLAAAAAYDEWIDDDEVGAGPYSGGLDDVDLEPLPPLEDGGSVAAVADAVLPSAVQIIAEFGGEDAGATGSGFVLDKQGHVVTNNHVVADAAADDGAIEVVDSEGRRLDATVVGRSPVYDLAVLQVAEDSDLKPAALGRSTTMRVGDPVVAIGSPLGLSATVTAGIVSALNRPVTTGNTDDDSSYINAVQTDAAINPGNSGGPLVDLRGQVIGVNSAIATNGGASGEAGNIGVGFAIPVEQVRVTADQILRTGEAQYPVIGANVRTGGTSDGDGAVLLDIVDGSPAQAAGLREDDRITAVDGQPVTDGISLIVAIRTHQPGETVEFTVVRNGRERAVEVTLDGEVG